MSFKQAGAVSTLRDKPLKLVDFLTYLGSNISSTESDDNISQLKVWTAIDRLSTVRKSDLSAKIKRDIFHIVVLGCPRGVMVKAMNCGIVVREFVLQSRYYVHFRANTLGKGMNPLILPPAMGK